MLYSENINKCFAIAVILCLVLADDMEEEEEGHSNSVAGMEKLLHMESKFIESLTNYAIEMEEKLKLVRAFVTQMQVENEIALKQTENYLSNPLNAFSLIRRMHEEWVEWKAYMEEPIGWSQVELIEKYKAKLPRKSDLEDACRAMERLRDVYDLKVRDMAKGLLNGIEYNVRLNALDTYALGQYYHRHQDKQLARDWFTETSNWLIELKLIAPIGQDHGHMLYLFAAALVKNKYYSIARPLIEHALKLGSENANKKILDLRADIESLSSEEKHIITDSKETNSTYKIGCRGLFKPQSKHYCHYKFSPSPFLRLAPLKMELVLLDPLIVVFYDVLSSSEIEMLQAYARPLLRRTAIYKDGKNIFQSTRTSKGTWLFQDASNLSKTIALRMEDMTDLSIEDSDGMQIMNYGLGGHYNVHYDYFDFANKETSDGEINDRIATVLFYLTEVDKGGGTVFPRLEQTFSPQPGMAVFWYNLNDDGTPNNKTLHGACPVLVGSKWIMTQWIYERPQIFTKPCLKR